MTWINLFTKNIHRKRKKGVLEISKEDEAGGDTEKAQPLQDEVEKPSEAGHEDDDAKQKKKSDDLWASFLSDVGSRPKNPTTEPQSSTTQKVDALKGCHWLLYTT